MPARRGGVVLPAHPLRKNPGNDSGPKRPGSGDEEEEKQIPMEQEPEAHPRFSKENRGEPQSPRDIRMRRPFREAAGFRTTKAGEPRPANFRRWYPQHAVDRSRERKAKKESCVTMRPSRTRPRTKIDQAGREPAPITGQPLADQESERDRCDQRERDRNARGRRSHAEDLVRERDHPVSQRGCLQLRDAVVSGQKPLLRFQHLTRAAGELAFDAVVEIAPGRGSDMHDGGKRQQKG